jgi:hypothetical protein
MITKAWRFVRVGPMHGLLCLLCDRVSFNPHDMVHHYCSACHLFLDDVAPGHLRPEEEAAFPPILTPSREDARLKAWPHRVVRPEDQCLNVVGKPVTFINPMCGKPNCTGDHK